MWLQHLCIKDGQWGTVLYILRPFHVPRLPFHLLGDREAHIPSDPTLFLFLLHLPSCSCLLIGSPGCSLTFRWSSSRLFGRNGCCSCFPTVHSLSCNLLIDFVTIQWAGVYSVGKENCPISPAGIVLPTRLADQSVRFSWAELERFPSPGWARPQDWSLGVCLLSVPTRIWHKGLSILFAAVLIDTQKYVNWRIDSKRRNKRRHFKSSVLPRTLMKSLPIPYEVAPGSIWSWGFHLTAQGLSLLTPPFGFSVVLSPALAGLAWLCLLPCNCRARLDGVKMGVG